MTSNYSDEYGFILKDKNDFLPRSQAGDMVVINARVTELQGLIVVVDTKNQYHIVEAYRTSEGVQVRGELGEVYTLSECALVTMGSVKEVRVPVGNTIYQETA